MVQSAAERNRKYRARKRLIDPDYTKKLYYDNRDKIIEQVRSRRLNPNSRAKSMLSETKHKQKDTDIDLTWIKDRLTKGSCELTGITFDYIKVCRFAPESPSIDRIDSNKVYFKDNCRIILCWLNIAKQDMPEKFFLDLLRKVQYTI